MNKNLHGLGVVCFTAVSIGGAAPAMAQAPSVKEQLQSVEPAAHPQADSVLSLITGSTQYSIFANMLQRSGLTSMLSGKGPFTVLVPSNAAFSSLPAGALEALLQPQNKSKLAEIVTNHILPGAIYSKDWTGNAYLGTTLGGQALSYTAGQYEQINSAPVVLKDIQTANGVVHVINAPLSLPSSR